MSNLIKVRVFNIKYDTDGQKIDLPTELFFDAEYDDDLADMISDETGFCVFSFEHELV